MKKFYSWYKKHITAAIFTGLILGIITGLFLANRFEPVLAITSLIGSIYMNALNMMIFPPLSWVSLASVMPAQPARSQPVP